MIAISLKLVIIKEIIMALAVTISPPTGGDVGKVYGTIAFDSSYVTGGEALTAAQLGAQRIKRIDLQDESGYIFETIYASVEPQSVLIKVYQAGGGTFTGSALAGHTHASQVTQDEAVTVTAGTGVSAALANIPVGSIDNIFITAGGVTGACTIVPVGSVTNSKEVSINYTTGVMQFLVADAVTSVKVTYTRATTTSVSAGTPAGSVAGAAGSEVANATDLSALTAVEFIATVFGDV